MVDHKTRELSVAELADAFEELRRKVCELGAHAMPLAEAKLVQRVYALETCVETRVMAEARLSKRVRDLEVMTRSGSTPAQRLVPRATVYPPVTAYQMQQAERDHLAKIEQLETELADAKAASGIKDEALAYVKQQRETLKEEVAKRDLTISDLNTQLGDALTSRDQHIHALSRRDERFELLQRQITEMRAVIVQKNAANKELSDGMAELRAENERLRQAHATACTEVSKLAVERDTLQQRLHVRKGKGHE